MFKMPSSKESKKNLPCKVLNFVIPLKTQEYVDHLLPFNYYYRDIHNLDITYEEKKVLKTRIKEYLFSSFNSCSENSEP